MMEQHDITAMLTMPSVEALVQCFPEHTYVHTISWMDWLTTETSLRLLLELEGNPDSENLDYSNAAKGLLEQRLLNLAAEHDIRLCHTASGENQNGDLEIALVFDTKADCLRFRLALP